MTSAFVRVLALVALLSAGWTSTANAATDPQKGAQAVLDARVNAIVNNNRTAYANTIDPQATEDFRNRELLKFDGARTVPLVGLGMNIDLGESGDLAAGLDLATKYSAGAAYLPKTVRTYRLGDFDNLPARDEFWYTYVERNGKWFIAADNDFELFGLQNTPALFDYGPVVAQQSAHFLVLASAGGATRAAEVDAIAEDAFTVMDQRWKISWSKRVPIVIPDTPEQAAKLLRTTNDVANFVAFVGYTPIREDTSYTITPPRVFSEEANLAAQSRDRQVATFTHELTHAASAPQAGPFTPNWMHEGLAEFIRYNRPLNYLGPAGTRSIPANDAFTQSGTALTNAYAASTSLMSYAARLKGDDAPERLFLAVGKRRVSPGTPSYNVDAAIREVLGVGLADFQTAWLTAGVSAK